MSAYRVSVWHVAIGTVSLILGLGTGRALAQQGATGGQWRYYGGDAGSTKYSPLDQINQSNIARLAIAWSADSPDRTLAGGRAADTSNFENTPLFVAGKLYMTSSFCQVAALDPLTGQTLWVFDPESYKAGRPPNAGFIHRGAAYWTDGTLERLYVDTHDANLWAIDAKTGKAATEFGDRGKVNLAAAIPLAVGARNYTMTSPPAIRRDRVIVGSAIAESPQQKEAPRGDVQAFDARTGKPAWIFHTVPQAGEFGNETWEQDSWRYTGNTNVWPPMSVDEELGYVYLPIGAATSDSYGGHRPGDNLFAQSLVCVDVTTGKRVWHFQTIHHGMWNYDLPAAPVLCNIQVDGKSIKAVAQVTKTGFTFVFDRVNGKPLWPIEERSVPQSTVPGERSALTQPIPAKPAPFELQGTTEENLIDFTPELRAAAKVILENLDHGPLFTPPSEKGAIVLPGGLGGANWWGAAFDPDTGMLYVPSVNRRRSSSSRGPTAQGANLNFVRGMGGNDAGPSGLPLFKPPYGRITAINLNTGEHAWIVPHGDGQRQRISQVVGRDVGPLGAGGTTGPLVTKSLLFVGQGGGGRSGGANVLGAYDKSNGKVLAEIALPAQPSGAPMTYLAGGKQFIVLATRDNRLVALAVADEKP